MTTQVKVAVIGAIAVVVAALIPALFKENSRQSISQNQESIDQTPEQRAPSTQIKQKLEVVHLEGEEFNESSDHVGVDSCSEGGRLLGWINDSEWIAYNNVYFGEGGYSIFEARVASAEKGGTITVRLNSPNGEVISSCGVYATGGWNSWRTVSCNLYRDLAGSNKIYLVFNGSAGYLFNINWIEFK
jgi:hypothetical protein